MDEQELIELLKSLEEHGWEPRLCDTEYTYYDTPIACGMPTPVAFANLNLYALFMSFIMVIGYWL